VSPGSSIGRVVAGRYRIVAPIGSGGHGVVDLAEDLLNGGRRVALKRLEGIVGAGDPEPAADHLRWFRHPRWAEVLDEGRLDAHGRFQVLRYVEGASLDHVGLPLPTDEVLAFLEDGARVLGALHARGLIHYDVTPGNFLREERGGKVVFTLTDGGLANLGPVKGIARGTVRFMAPEVADGAPHDHRVDLYALGLVAFRLATGRDPWSGGAGDVLGGRRREPAPSIRAVRTDADPRLESIIAALLERDPNRRVPDAAALLALLVEAGRSTAAAPLEGELIASAESGFVFGREREIERFRTACRALLGGAPSPALPTGPVGAPTDGEPTVALADNVLLVCGATGSGGTRLVREYGAIARAEGVALLTLSGREGAADRRGPLRRLADGIALLTGQDDPLATTGRADQREGRDDATAGDDVRGTERFITLCDRTAEKTPLVLVVEDFEEFPASAQEAIRVLARHLLSRSEHPDGRAPSKVLLVVDHGAEDPQAFLLPDAVDPRRPVQTLKPLTVEAIRAIAADRFAGLEPVAEDAETVRAVSEGLPGLVVAVLAQARERGDLRRDGAVWIWNASSTPSYALDRRVSASQARALASLSPAALEVAQYLALLEVPVPEEFLLQLCSREAIDEFTASCLASTSRETSSLRITITSRHCFRHAVLSKATAASQSRLVANLLSVTAVPPVELAPELARLATAHGQPVVALRLLTTPIHQPSSQWTAHAQSVATQLLTGVHPELTTDVGALTRLLIPGPRAAELASALVRATRAGRTRSLDSVNRLARYLLRSHRPADALLVCQLLDATELRVGASTPDSARLHVLTFRAHRSLDGPRPDTDLRRRAVLACRSLGKRNRESSPDICTEYFLGRGRELFAAGASHKAVGAFRRALRRSTRAHDPSLLVASLNNLAVALRSTGAHTQAEKHLLRALRVRMASGDAAGAAGQAHNLARLYQHHTRLRDAASLLHQATMLAGRHGHVEAQSLSLGVLAEVQDQLGNTQLAHANSLRAHALAAKCGNSHLAQHTALVCAELCSALGHVNSARQFMRSAMALARTSSGIPLTAIRLTAAQIRENLAITPRRRAEAGNPSAARAVVRLLPARNNIASISTTLTDDLFRRGTSSPFRAALAGILRGMRRYTPDTNLLPSIATLDTSRVGGASRRFALALVIDVLSSASIRNASWQDTLRTVSDMASKYGLHHLRGRALAARASSAISAGDLSGASTLLPSALSAVETAASEAEPVRCSAGTTLPRELRALADQCITSRLVSTGSVIARSDTSLVLHAAAHKLSRRWSSTGEADSRRESALRAVLSSAAQLKTGAGVDALLSMLSERARVITRAERACVVLVVPGEAERRIAGESGDGATAPAIASPISKTIIERALVTKSPLLLHDVFGDADLMGRPSILSMQLRSVLCVPLVHGDVAFGVMYADSSKGAGSFDRTDLEVLSLFAEQASAAIESSRLVDDLQKSYRALQSAQDRLIQGERLRVIGEMTSGVAHEFNNLLTAILARVQLMSLDGLPDSTREHLRLVERASMDAAAVVRRLQGYSRAQRQGTHRVVDLSIIGSDVVELLRPIWTSRRRHNQQPISVRYRATPSQFVLADPIEMREVLTNLLKNSIEAFTGRGGDISVSVSTTGTAVRAEVSDNAGGIPPEVAQRLFTPFLTTKGDRGTGLGLCLCQQILERHGTSLRVVNRAPNGTTVSFDLPRVEDARQDSGDPSGSTAARSRRTPRVLVVDDDPNVLHPLCACLMRSGLSVTGANGAAEALAHMQTFNPDIVVSDVAMPGTDGIELCAALHRDRPSLPIILMSGQASEVDASRVRGAGATALLSKPFTMKQIEELVHATTMSTSDNSQAEPPMGLQGLGGMSERPGDGDGAGRAG